MKKTILHINTAYNDCSTGKIMKFISDKAMENGWQSYVAYGRGKHAPEKANLIPIGNPLSLYKNALTARCFDNDGFLADNNTLDFVKKIKQIKPSIVHIHNLHGYYINIEILFESLKALKVPVVLTMHDCWTFTGHCPFFTYTKCNKWLTGCGKCPLTNDYPASRILDCSSKNFLKKKEIFCGFENIKFASPSDWLRDLAKESFLKNKSIVTVRNGIDLDTFRKIDTPKHDSFNILGVASTWCERKGTKDFFELRKKLDSSYKITLIGLSSSQIRELPDGIVGIKRTRDMEELAKYYNSADLFLNPTYDDNYPTTNLESLACATPALVYDSGGTAESIDEATGSVVKQGDVDALYSEILRFRKLGKQKFTDACQTKAKLEFGQELCFRNYLNLYNELLS